jgi:hypothetical protein
MQILTLAIQMTGGVLGAVWSHATVPPVAGAPSRSTPRPPSWGESMPMTYCEASTCAFEPDAAVLAIDGHSELVRKVFLPQSGFGIVDRELAELGHTIQRRHRNL